MLEKEEENALGEADAKSPNVQKQIDDIFYTIKPAIIVENFYGIFRLRLVNGELDKPSIAMKLAGIFIALVVVLCFSTTITFPAVITGTSSVVDVVGDIPAIVVLVQYMMSVVTTSFLLSKQTIRILASIADIDDKLRINIDQDFYKYSNRQTIKYLVILIASHVFTTIADVMTDKSFSPFKIVILCLYTQQDVEIFMFCKMVYMLKARLGVINDYLSKFVLEQKKSSSIFTVSKKDVVIEKKWNFIGRVTEDNMKIRDLAVLYDVIGETCTLINEIFNFQIFMNLLSTFTYIVITIWTTLYYLRTPDDVGGQLITVIIWCVMTVLSVAVMSFTCESLLATRRSTQVLVNEVVMDYELPRRMRMQAKVFMELVDAWPLKILVYDMFSVDITLMLKFISVATTFLIVIIQVSHLV